MTAIPNNEPLLDEEHARFIQGRVAMIAASRNPENLPSLARVYGCRVSSDRQKVTIFVSTFQSETLRRDLSAGAPIAVVFTLPSTHQTLQLKGASASIAELEEGDPEIMQAYGKAFAGELKSLGYQSGFADAVAAVKEGSAMAVSFMPTAAFVQTPGPSAGTPLERKS